ncbi:MAG: ATP-binding protein [Bacteroidales bacterium]|nr:ATP-binding protein [Bacteroidales bacterium]MCF8403781.1 ATP-binding protein [Bacteroidales bacterium]
MTKIPFKVSARAARLIGRENVANAEGAVIELVKNGYDADANISIILFDNKYYKTPDELKISEYKELRSIAKVEDFALLASCYLNQGEGKYILQDNIDATQREFLDSFFHNLCTIYIMDSGHGMTVDVIQNHWMIIGTDIKETNYKSDFGRIKTGAKGIGRFALDRLGDECEMLTKTVYGEYCVISSRKEKNVEANRWRVKWSSFEGKQKSIDQVNADLELIKDVDITKEVKKLIRFFPDFDKILKRFQYNSGTILKISGLRDKWNDNSIEKIFASLEYLIPPKEDDSYSIYLLSTLTPNKYGKIDPPSIDQFDYHLNAKYLNNNPIEITITRNELLYKNIDPEVFQVKRMNVDQFSPKTFIDGSYTYTKTIEELVPGLSDSFKKFIIPKIGTFEFDFYFGKMGSGPAERGTSKFPYKGFDLSFRKIWFKRFGGIKIYRDGFRVRPYGEPDGNAFDWLGLGQLSSQSPTVTKSGYHVRPNQVYGIINISRIENVNFSDRSSREGIQENPVFNFFKQLIISLIAEFERDRNIVMMSIKEVFEKKDKEEFLEKESDNIIKKAKLSEPTNECEEERKVLSEAVEYYKERIASFEDEQMLLRVLASTGLIITSFAHELKNLTDRIVPRTDTFRDILNQVIDKTKLNQLQDFENPFIMLDDFRNQDTRLSNWLGFSLSAVRRDKRKLKKIEVISYIAELVRLWHTILESRGIELIIKHNIYNELYIEGNPIDFDAIFNNLITNSIDAFKRKKKHGATERKIFVTFWLEDDVIITYADSGPGLDDEITDPYWIIEPFNTTKRNDDGEITGTGLGMYIVKHVLDQYDAELKIFDQRPGFKIELIIPSFRKHEQI